jgi:hypothetical protein
VTTCLVNENLKSFGDHTVEKRNDKKVLPSTQMATAIYAKKMETLIALHNVLKSKSMTLYIRHLSEPSES